MSIPSIESIKTTMNDLGARVKALIETGVRAKRRPVLKRCWASGPLDRRFVAGIQLHIDEVGTTPLITTGGKVTYGLSTIRLVLDYGITAEGVAVSLFAPIPDWRGGERAYKRCVQDWVDVVYAAVQAETSKRRVVARTKEIKEELMAKMWAPERVAAMLEKGGWELIDGL